MTQLKTIKTTFFIFLKKPIVLLPGLIVGLILVVLSIVTAGDSPVERVIFQADTGASAGEGNADLLDGLDAKTSGVDAHIVATDSSGNLTVSGNLSGNLECTTCVSTGEVDFTWALGATKGGNAATANDLSCNNCIGGTQIGDGLGISEIDETVFQQRVSGTCDAGNSIRIIAQDGTVTCEADTDDDTWITTQTCSTDYALQSVGKTSKTCINKIDYADAAYACNADGTCETGAISASGNIAAESNTWGTCYWTDFVNHGSTGAGDTLSCSNGYYMVRLNWKHDGGDDWWQEQERAYCCRL